MEQKRCPNVEIVASPWQPIQDHQVLQSPATALKNYKPTPPENYRHLGLTSGGALTAEGGVRVVNGRFLDHETNDTAARDCSACFASSLRAAAVISGMFVLPLPGACFPASHTRRNTCTISHCCPVCMQTRVCVLLCVLRLCLQVFETTIRILGGLLAAYFHSGGDEMFLNKALEFGNR